MDKYYDNSEISIRYNIIRRWCIAKVVVARGRNNNNSTVIYAYIPK